MKLVLSVVSFQNEAGSTSFNACGGWVGLRSYTARQAGRIVVEMEGQKQGKTENVL
jgi:hypothetical protein